MSMKNKIKEALEKAGISVDKIKLALSSIKLEDLPPPPSKNEVKLKDGTSFMVDGDIKEGAKVTIVTPEGSVDVTDGDYTSEDGTVYSIAGGIISKITPASAQADPDMPSMMKSLMTEVTAIKSQLSGITKENTQLKSALESANANTKLALQAVEVIANITPEEPEFTGKKWEEMTEYEKRQATKKNK